MGTLYKITFSSYKYGSHMASHTMYVYAVGMGVSLREFIKKNIDVYYKD